MFCLILGKCLKKGLYSLSHSPHLNLRAGFSPAVCFLCHTYLFCVELQKHQSVVLPRWRTRTESLGELFFPCMSPTGTGLASYRYVSVCKAEWKVLCTVSLKHNRMPCHGYWKRREVQLFVSGSYFSEVQMITSTYIHSMLAHIKSQVLSNGVSCCFGLF